MPIEFMTEEGNQYIIYPESKITYTPLPISQIRPQKNLTCSPINQTQPPQPCALVQQTEQTPNPVDVKNMKWKKGSLIFDENIRPHNNVSLPDDICKLATPLQIFFFFYR